MRLSIRSFAFLLILGLLAGGPRTLLAQITADTTHWNDEELYEEETMAGPAYFAVGGGVLVNYFMPDLGSFNRNIARPFVKKDINDKIWMIGGQGFISVPWVKNLRVGGMGFSGASEQCCQEVTVTSEQLSILRPISGDTVQIVRDTLRQNVNRMLEYRVGYGALTLDYVLPLKMGSFRIVPGVALGLGAVEIFARQATARKGFDIEIEAGSAYNQTHTYSSNFFLYMPQIQFEYNPLGYMMIRASAAYQGTSMGAWKVDRDIPFTNDGSLSDVNGSGLTFGIGLFFGLFQ